MLGVTLLIKRFRPVVPALLLAAAFPIAVAIVQVISLGSVSLPLAFAFGFLGRRIARATDPWSPLQLSGGGHQPAVLQATGRMRRTDG